MAKSDSKTSQSNGDQDRVPPMQKLFDRPFLLLGLGMLVMMIFYTGWGVIELLTLPQSKLP